MYTLRENEEALTQNEICDALYQPKQTVTSSLKKLEHDGFIELTVMEDRCSKRIALTKKGLSLAEKTVDRVIAAEQEALSELTADEQEAFVSLFRKYTDLLEIHMLKIEEKKEP